MKVFVDVISVAIASMKQQLLSKELQMLDRILQLYAFLLSG
jgi:hypothetical protein